MGLGRIGGKLDERGERQPGRWRASSTKAHSNSGHVVEQKKKKKIRFAFTKSADGKSPWPMRTGVPPRTGGIKDEPDLVCCPIIN